MRRFSIEQIEDYLNYTNEYIMDLEEMLGSCVICGRPLSEATLPEGPESKVVCLEHRESFVKQYEELIESRNMIDIDEEQRKEKAREEKNSVKIEGLTVGEIILLDWIHLKKVNKKKPAYFDRLYCTDGELSSSKLNEEGYIRIGTAPESLNGLKVDELRKILQKNLLKTTGGKKVLLERIQSELDEKDYSNFVEPTWILDEKGKIFLEKYNVFVWAHKKFSTIGYEIAVTPYSVVPYANSSMSNEMVAISITKKFIEKALRNRDEYYYVESNCLFQANMYSALNDEENSLNSLLLGFLFVLTGSYGGQFYKDSKQMYVGIVGLYTNYKKALITIQHNHSKDYIIDRAKSIYQDYEYLLPEIRLYNSLSEFIEALSITLWGTEKEWNDCKTKWEKKMISLINK